MTHHNHARANQQEKIAEEIARRAGAAHASLIFNLLTDEELLDHVDALTPPHRERMYTPTMTLSLYIQQVLSADGSCQAVVDDYAAARAADGLPVCSTATGGYCRARERLPTEMVQELTKLVGGNLSGRQRPVFRGRHVKLVDGSTTSMPDTEENQAAFPQQTSQGAEVGFPGLRLVAIVCLGTGAILNTAMAPLKGKETGEMALLREMLDTFEPGDIVVADRYYASYFMVAALIERGVDVLFESHASRATDVGKGEDRIAEWSKPAKPKWMSREDYAAVAPTLSVRELEVGHKVLVTTLRSKRSAPRQELGELFQQRWHIELDLRNIKATLGMGILRNKSPEMAIKEMWVYWLAYNLIRVLMAQAAVHAGCPPRQISFKHTVQLWLAWSVRFHLAFMLDPQQRILLYQVIVSKRVGRRPGRVEPREVKRRPKPYRLLKRTRFAAREDIRQFGHPKKVK